MKVGYTFYHNVAKIISSFSTRGGLEKVNAKDFRCDFGGMDSLISWETRSLRIPPEAYPVAIYFWDLLIKRRLKLPDE